jgi:hypothetical protein
MSHFVPVHLLTVALNFVSVGPTSTAKLLPLCFYNQLELVYKAIPATGRGGP